MRTRNYTRQRHRKNTSFASCITVRSPHESYGILRPREHPRRGNYKVPLQQYDPDIHLPRRLLQPLHHSGRSGPLVEP